jgi:TolA-binding protein
VEFAEFAEKYPKSDHFAEAVMLQAESDFKQQKFSRTIDVLTAHESQAGKFADQYVYWIGESQFQGGNYALAAGTFGRLAQNFPNSRLRLDAVVNEAAALARLNQWRQASALLEEPGSDFETDAKKHPADERVVRGQLLLAESLLEQDKLDAAAAILDSLPAQNLAPELKWRQIQLLCRVQLVRGDTNAALASTTNLIELAGQTGQADMRAASAVEQGRVLEKMGRPGDALEAYRENLSTNLPAEWQRQAILKIAELAAAQTNFSEAEQSLGKFLNQFPNSPAAEVARLTLGELFLKEYATQPAVATNSLEKADAQFDQFLDSYPDRTLTGKAYLDRGWCEWLAKDMTNSLADFKAAANVLPRDSKSETTCLRKKIMPARETITRRCGGILPTFRQWTKAWRPRRSIRPFGRA